ncbi:MAG: winged helix-turn-helix domain-containing protein, partial [Alphaproteobacteria bacterium]
MLHHLTPAQPTVKRAQFIHDALRDMIASGQLKPGDRLPTEEDLCAHFKVSRTTLREAIQMLRVAGLLSVSPGRGSYIQQPHLPQVMNDMGFYARMAGVTAADANGVLLCVFTQLMGKLVASPLAQRRTLFEHVLGRTDTPEQAEEKERQWLLSLAKNAGGMVQEMLVHMLLAAQKTERLRRFADADEVMRVLQTQIRFNTTVVDGDETTAKRLLETYFIPLTQAVKSALKSSVNGAASAPRMAAH